MNFTPTRAAGLSQLDAFLPEVQNYAAVRNFAEPDAAGVSRLSPYLSSRLLTEAEVCRAVLAHHPYPTVEKFIQEVCWRSYWKGWLEMRPAVWHDYLRELAHLKTNLDNAVQKELERAQAGQTGIACFDDWTHALIADGYLHNHVRMWYASIWIFTLRLPWQLGAAFFYHHLLDADAASNTLSWRWVAGLQTIGKHYLARAENIHRYTNGRYFPLGQLNENAQPLPSERPHPRPNLQLPQQPPLPTDKNTTGLLLQGDDLSPEIDWMGPDAIGHLAGAPNCVIEQHHSPAMNAFYRQAFADALRRNEEHFATTSTLLDTDHWQASVLGWVRTKNIRTLLTPYAPVGHWADCLNQLESQLGKDCQLLRITRAWDTTLWPHADKGFFKFRQCLPQKLDSL